MKTENRSVRNIRSLKRGEPFHDLKVVSMCEKDAYGKVCYLCQCKCGNFRKVRRSYLLSGRTKSCGCGKKIASSETGKRSIHFAIDANKRFVGDLSGALWGRVVTQAKMRSLEVGVTQRQAWDLFVKQDKKCALTGVELFLDPHHCNRQRVTASLDRIDSGKGYVKGNIQWVHKDVNLMKNGFSEHRFREICRLVTENDTKPTK